MKVPIIKFIIILLFISTTIKFFSDQNELIKRKVIIMPVSYLNKKKEYEYLSELLRDSLKAKMNLFNNVQVINFDIIDEKIKNLKIDQNNLNNYEEIINLALSLKSDIFIKTSFSSNINMKHFHLSIEVYDLFYNKKVLIKDYYCKSDFELLNLIDGSSNDIMKWMKTNIIKIEKKKLEEKIIEFYFDEKLKNKIQEKGNTTDIASNKAIENKKDETSDNRISHNKIKKNINFRLITDFYAYPLVYDYSNDWYGISLNGSLETGCKLNKFSITFEANERYFSISSNEDGKNIEGAWNILRGTINGYFEPVKYFELKWGIGGAFYSSAFNYSQQLNIDNKYGGISFLLDTTIRFPFKYFQIKLLNKFDLFFINNYVFPYHNTDIRGEFHPYFRWISIYLNIGIMTYYHNDYFFINNILLTWGAGIIFNLSIPEIFKKKR